MPSFRLLQLPQSVQLEVVRNIEVFELTIFSLLSTKTKNLVKLLEKSPFTSIKLHCGEHIFINVYASDWRIICKFVFYKDYFDQGNLNRIHPVVVEVKKLIRGDVYEQFFSPIRENYGMRDWLNHFLAITKVRKICLDIDDSTQFNYDSIFQTLSGIKISYMSFDDLALMKYTHRVEHVLLGTNPESIHQKQKILMQNWDFLSFGGVDITLNDLLIANCKTLQLPSSEYYFKDLNRFLKLWKRGIMHNSRMEQLSMGYFGDEDEDVIHNNMNGLIGAILEGIDHKVIGQDVKRRFKRFSGIEINIQGGYDIINVFCQKATVIIDNELLSFDFYFWP